MESDNSDVMITWNRDTEKMPITCQSWHIPKSKGYTKVSYHFPNIELQAIIVLLSEI